MKDVFALLHLAVMTAKLVGAGGVQTVIAENLILWVSNSSLRSEWGLDEAPAVGDPPHMAEIGNGDPPSIGERQWR